MTWFRTPLLPAWLRRLTGSCRPEARGEVCQARDLICAIDAGGIPLNPMRVNAIARSLGLEVSGKATFKLPGGKWTPHDLRRTGATMMGALGVLPEG